MPIEGGATTYVGHPLGEATESQLSVSPDNNYLAYAYEEHEPEPATKFVVISVEGGPPVKVLPAPGGQFGLHWGPDGKSLEYLVTSDGVTNLWEQQLDGGEASQLTNFTSGLICNFNWSFDHKELILARGEARSDVILLTNFH